jgi:hypothetical protein
MYSKASDVICKSTFCGKSYIRNKTLARMGTTFISQVIRVFMNVFWNCCTPRSLKLISVYINVYTSLSIWLGTNTMVDFSKREV